MPVKARVSELPKFSSSKPISSRFMKQLASKVQREIRIRTLKGEGVIGPEDNLQERRHKKPYSERYKKHRRKHGRNVSRVDHVYSGRMLNSMRTSASNLRATITVSASQMEKAYFTNKLRPWFYMSKKQQIKAGDALAKEIARFYK